jgi:hypothetical protein
VLIVKGLNVKGLPTGYHLSLRRSEVEADHALAIHDWERFHRALNLCHCDLSVWGLVIKGANLVSLMARELSDLHLVGGLVILKS